LPARNVRVRCDRRRSFMSRVLLFDSNHHGISECTGQTMNALSFMLGALSETSLKFYALNIGDCGGIATRSCRRAA
jgi:hypothetical protein